MSLLSALHVIEPLCDNGEGVEGLEEQEEERDGDILGDSTADLPFLQSQFRSILKDPIAHIRQVFVDPELLVR